MALVEIWAAVEAFPVPVVRAVWAEAVLEVGVQARARVHG
eukprot:CAMPEP_0173311974 /NCGR_PEP_ID=MMETSP1143-20121109/23858_1 /TAXON_ID=483371 /ORGANISM="non described non described, Strain CCMP2298" /LENGTH=39 /DNA_ID= /DNA_START= /DNA_END= /DNA_ORIENTATION=